MEQLSTVSVSAPVGTFWVWASERAVIRVLLPGRGDGRVQAGSVQSQVMAERAADLLYRYCQGVPVRLDLPVDIDSMPPFFRTILEAARDVPRGCTVTYGQLAVLGGRRNAARAVGQAMARNPVPLFVPCHRVVGHGGAAGGYGGGLDLKRWLLQLEGVNVRW